MSREYEPGDVALLPGGQIRVFYVGERVGEPRPWRAQNGAALWGDGEDPRPLVVIDPEDREQVAVIAEAINAQRELRTWATLAGDTYDMVQAALRVLIADPKPPEPTGLGAVVEVESNRDGLKGMPMRLVRTHATREPWYGDNQKRDWDEIDGPIKVLSEGVTA